MYYSPLYCQTSLLFFLSTNAQSSTENDNPTIQLLTIQSNGASVSDIAASENVLWCPIMMTCFREVGNERIIAMIVL